MKNALCSDKKCRKKGTCSRYIADPKERLEVDHKVKVNNSLRAPGFAECAYYVAPNVSSKRQKQSS